VEVCYGNYQSRYTLSDEFLAKHPTSIFSTLKADTGITSLDLSTVVSDCKEDNWNSFNNVLGKIVGNEPIDYSSYDEDILLLLDRTSLKPFTFFSYSDLAIRAEVKNYELCLSKYLNLPSLTLEQHRAIVNGLDMQKLYFIGIEDHPFLIFSSTLEVYFYLAMFHHPPTPFATTSSGSLTECLYQTKDLKTLFGGDDLMTTFHSTGNKIDSLEYFAFKTKCVSEFIPDQLKEMCPCQADLLGQYLHSTDRDGYRGYKGSKSGGCSEKCVKNHKKKGLFVINSRVFFA